MEEMNGARYRDLLLRFAKEIDEVGVTENMLKIIEVQIARQPNVCSTDSHEVTDRFVYRRDGYMIEAKRTVSVVVKKCK